MLRLAASLLALATLASACSIPSRPAWWPKPKQSPGATAAAGSPAAQASPAPVAVVADPWQPGMRQLGIQVYWLGNSNDTSDAVVAAKARRVINYAVSLDANSIAVSFPFYTTGISSNEVFARPGLTPTPAHMAIFLAAAAASHIRVTLRPVLNEDALVAQNPLAWRGTITPTSTAAWFESYRRFLLPYAAVAQAGHAATFVIGTELDSLEGSPHWHSLISAIRSVFSGQLTYDENYDEFQEVADPVLPLTTYDIDAYPRFDLPDSASVSKLTGAWDGWLGAHPASVRHQLTLSEVGISAVPGSYSDPGAWLSTEKSPIDTQIQANWYQAVCDSISVEHIGGGVYWWEISFDADPADPALFRGDRLTFLGRPAAQVIKSCFERLSS